MTTDALRKIKTVEARPGYRLLVSWSHGPQTSMDLSEMVHEGGVFDALQDENEFSRVTIGDRNRTIGWPEPKDDQGYPMIEIDADALYAIGSQQKSASTMQRLLNAARSVERASKPV